jgi:hypothetical protein
MIPKNIIQIQIGEDSTSEYLMHLSKKWGADYPDWNHKVYSNQEIEKIVKEYSDRAWEFYKNCPIFSFKADFARLILLHKFGGVYIDIDTRPSLDMSGYILKTDNLKWWFSFSLNQNGDIITNNDFVATEKKSPVIEKIISNALDNFFIVNNKIDGDYAYQNGFKFAELVSTKAWGHVVKETLDDLCNGDFLGSYKTEIAERDSFWVSWDGKKISITNDFETYTHIGGMFIKDFMDVNVINNPIDAIAELYRDFSIQNGEIKIYSRGL